MEEFRCCGRVMYQEIDLQNYLVSNCRICGKTTKKKVHFSAPKTGQDGHQYINLNVEKFNNNSGESHE